MTTPYLYIFTVNSAIFFKLQSCMVLNFTSKYAIITIKLFPKFIGG